MARGWDRGGNNVDDKSSWRLICGDPPGPGLGGGRTTGFRPNSFCGLAPWDITPPLIAVGVGDYSIEYWSLWKLEDNPGPDIFFYTGFAAEDIPGRLGPMGCVRYAAAAQTIRAYYDDVAGVAPAPVFSASDPVPAVWSHIAVNFNRAGNADVYINGALGNSVAINANNQGNIRFYALVGAIDQENQYNAGGGLGPDWTGFVQARVLMGPISAHSRLMTAAEINNSAKGRRVQNFGTPNTVVCWDWRLIEELDGGPVTWGYNENRTQEAFTAGISGLGIAYPIGAAGTIRIPDLSGSENHWVLPTLAEYAQVPATAGRSTVAFITHPFWMSS